jgi:spermidine synthase
MVSLFATFAAQQPNRKLVQNVSPAKSSIATPVRTWLLWIFLAALGTLLLTSTTTILTEDVSASPLIWILPLAIYLLSFILTFESSAWYKPKLFAGLAVLGTLAMIAAVRAKTGNTLSIQALAGGLFLFCGAMLAHGELVKRKPATDRLTLFYIVLALGGMLGGGFAALAAPYIFADYFEFHLAAFLLVGLATYVFASEELTTSWRRVIMQGSFIPLLGALLTCVIIGFDIADRYQSTEFLSRNFYGTLKIVLSGRGETQERVLMHGSTLHGSEFVAENKKALPTSYYGPSSGAGVLLSAMGQQKQSLRIGVVGLGTGTLASYGRRADAIDYYEINPAVINIAQTQFSYLSGSQANIIIHEGDARLLLASEQKQFDALLLDAFSSDAVPVHLLTSEAFSIYLSRLAPGGILAVHISNRHLKLAPIITAQAKHYGLVGAIVRQSKQLQAGEAFSEWVLLAQNPQDLAKLTLAPDISADLGAAGQRWTDNQSSILPLLGR